MAGKPNKAKRPRSSKQEGADVRRKGREKRRAEGAGVRAGKGGAGTRAGKGGAGASAGSSARSAAEQRAGLGSGMGPSMVAVALLCALVLFQGGYYAGAVCAIALLATAAFAIAALVVKGLRACAWPSIALLAIACAYLASAIAHQCSATMLQETATWFAVAGLSLWCTPATSREKQVALQALASAGVVLAGIGVLMFAGALPVQGAVNAGRLMFTFQYANTAGLFFAVIAILCLNDRRMAYRAAAVLPIAALALTQSGGAIAVFLVAVVALVVRWAHTEKPERVPLAGVYGGLAAGVVALAGAAFAFWGERVAQATQTFTERLVQVLDALGVLANNVLFGIGPDQWQFLFPSVQSAQYRAANVHCSYLQAAVDAGVVALVLLVAFVVVAIVRLAQRREFASLVCVGMIAVHALVDFDLQFASMVVLLALLAAEPRDGSGAAAKGDGAARPALSAFADALASRGAVLCWAVAACAIAASCAGVYLDLKMGEVQNAASRGDARQAESLVLSQAYFENDAALHSMVVTALYAADDDQELVDFVRQTGASGGATQLRYALSLHRLGQNDEAAEAFARALAEHPYDVELYKAARQNIEDMKLGEPFGQLYNQAAAQANALAVEGHAAWLAGQEQLEEWEADR